MTVSNTTVKNTYSGNGSTQNFAVPFDLTDNTVVKVYLIDTTVVDASTPSGYDETLQVETTHFTFDADPATQVQMITAPTSTEQLRVQRVTPLTQATDLASGVDGEESTEEALDKLTRIVQELDDRLDAEEAESPSSSSVSATAADWATSTSYTEDQLVVRSSVLYRCTTTHTSNIFDTDFLTNSYWEVMVGKTGAQGPAGNAGAQGPTGATGAAGSNGVNGADGADGIFSAIASQGEAEAGTDNVKGMTALRVAQAIAAQVDEAQISTNATNIATLQSAVNALTARVTTLEQQVQQSTGKFAGQQTLLNSQTTAKALIGDDEGGANDYGAGLDRQQSGTLYAKVMVYIFRKTDTAERFVSFDLVMQYVSGQWWIRREDDQQLNESLDLDGVTLSVQTDGSGRGQVYYQTDTMSGSDHDDESIIGWLGQEISKYA